MSFEYFIDNNKIITNCGYGNKISRKEGAIRRLTSAQSTLCLNDSPVVHFKDNLFNDIFGTAITTSFQGFIGSDENNFTTTLGREGSDYKVNPIDFENFKIDKKNSNLFGEDIEKLLMKIKKIKIRIVSDFISILG